MSDAFSRLSGVFGGVFGTPAQSASPFQQQGATLSRGARAKALLADELLQEAMREVAMSAHRLFEQASSPEQLQRASDLLVSANHFARFLRSIAEAGQAEVNKREREISRGKRVDRDPVLRGLAWRA